MLIISLGDVMKESALIALNWLRSNAAVVSVFDRVKIYALPNELKSKTCTKAMLF